MCKAPFSEEHGWVLDILFEELINLRLSIKFQTWVGKIAHVELHLGYIVIFKAPTQWSLTVLSDYSFTNKVPTMFWLKMHFKRFVILSGLEQWKQTFLTFSMTAFKTLFSQKLCNCGWIFKANLIFKYWMLSIH